MRRLLLALVLTLAAVSSQAAVLFEPYRHNSSLLRVLTDLGLTTNLRLVLDAGDAASYSSGQVWLDIFGSGYDFNRGATSGAEASDPTFNGSANGLSSAEFWSLDGGDFFTYDAANETWMNSLHKDGTAFTLMAWIYPTSVAAVSGIVGTSGASSSQVGIQFRLNTTGALGFIVQDGSGANALNVNSGAATVTLNAWNMVALTVDEAGNLADFQVNAATDTNAGAFDTPSASSATHTMQIGALGNAANQAQSGMRISMLAAWEGGHLSSASLDSIYQATRQRFGV